jgi:hypothetical protein
MDLDLKQTEKLSYERPYFRVYVVEIEQVIAQSVTSTTSGPSEAYDDEDEYNQSQTW